MAMSTYGTLFSAGTIVGEIQTISFGGVSVTAIDVSILTTASKKYAAGFSDGGSITLTMMAAPAAQQQIEANSTTSSAYSIKFGTPATGNPQVNFNAFRQSQTFEAQPDGVIMTTLVLRTDGAVTVVGQAAP